MEDLTCRDYVVSHAGAYSHGHPKEAWKFERIIASKLACQWFWVEMNFENAVLVYTVRI